MTLEDLRQYLENNFQESDKAQIVIKYNGSFDVRVHEDWQDKGYYRKIHGGTDKELKELLNKQL